MNYANGMRGARACFRRVGGLGLIALAVALSGCADEKAGQAATPPQQPPTKVSVARVAPQAVTLERIYPARAQAADDVEVRARVQGILLKRNYSEGSQVKAGTVLFQIDPATFEARAQQAEAEFTRAQAQLRQAEREWNRTTALFKDNAVSARQRDEALSALELAQANQATAQAVLRDARIQLEYTKVKAPISGYTGLRAVSEGNLVQPGDLLTTIRQLDPVHVLFSMPETDALAHRQRLREGGAAAAKQTLAATLLLNTGAAYEHKGIIDFTATVIDPQTGTVQARGVFSNPQGILLPGQFVRVSLNGLEIPNVIVVPPQAVSQGAQGPIVYIVDEQNVAQARPVKLGQSVREGQIIAEGLTGGERVIVNGIIGVRPGAPVAPTETGASAEVAAGSAETAAAAGAGR